MTNAPSRNPAGNDTITGLLNFVLLKFLQSIDACLPAKVIAYDIDTNRAQVQPLIVQVTTGDEQVARAQVASVPVARWGAGGFLIYFPVASGDKGWLIANDRDISIYKQTGEQSPPNTNRLHEFADGWFLPDTALEGATLADSGKCCIQSTDGTTAITMGGGILTLKAPTQIVLDTPIVTTTGTFDVLNSASSSASCTINGSIHATGDVVGNGISLDSHRHSGVTTGGGDTGGPI